MFNPLDTSGSKQKNTLNICFSFLISLAIFKQLMRESTSVGALNFLSGNHGLWQVRKSVNSTVIFADYHMKMSSYIRFYSLGKKLRLV